MVSLLADIKSAFAHRPMPTVVTAYEDDPVDGADAAWFRGKRVESLGAADWRGRETALFFFTNEAFCYYLQNVMIIGLNEKSGVDVVGTLLARLDRPKLSYWHQTDAALFSTLQAAELAAMRDWLIQLSEVGQYDDDLVSNVERTLILAEEQNRAAG